MLLKITCIAFDELIIQKLFIILYHNTVIRWKNSILNVKRLISVFLFETISIYINLRMFYIIYIRVHFCPYCFNA